MANRFETSAVKCVLFALSGNRAAELITYNILTVFCGKTEKPGVKGCLVFVLTCIIFCSCPLHFSMSPLTCSSWKSGAGTAEWVNQQRMLVACGGSAISHAS